jgi:hypothetical protein
MSRTPDKHPLFPPPEDAAGKPPIPSLRVTALRDKPPPPLAGEGRGAGPSDPLSPTGIATGIATGTPKEIGGPKGPEPTRYGDWEVGGRCTDF